MKPWMLTYGEHTWTNEQATAAHLVAVADIAGDRWEVASPWTGPRALAAWAAVMIASLKGGEGDAVRDALVEVYMLPMGSLIDMLGDPPATTEG